MNGRTNRAITYLAEPQRAAERADHPGRHWARLGAAVTFAVLLGFEITSWISAAAGNPLPHVDHPRIILMVSVVWLLVAPMATDVRRIAR